MRCVAKLFVPTSTIISSSKDCCGSFGLSGNLMAVLSGTRLASLPIHQRPGIDYFDRFSPRQIGLSLFVFEYYSIPWLDSSSIGCQQRFSTGSLNRKNSLDLVSQARLGHLSLGNYFLIFDFPGAQPKGQTGKQTHQRGHTNDTQRFTDQISPVKPMHNVLTLFPIGDSWVPSCHPSKVGKASSQISSWWASTSYSFTLTSRIEKENTERNSILSIQFPFPDFPMCNSRQVDSRTAQQGQQGTAPTPLCVWCSLRDILESWYLGYTVSFDQNKVFIENA